MFGPAWAFRRFFIYGILCLVVISVLSRRRGVVPAFGEFLNPFKGAWLQTPSPFENQNGEHHKSLQGLNRPVEVWVDRDQIKHVFAATDEDLYFAQGYVVASDRLWEMEFLKRLASGKLSEIMGAKTLEFDKLFIKSGIPRAAAASADLMLNDPLTGSALQAYARGVNAYIETLDWAHLPFEYKLLGIKPEPWSARDASLLLKFMAWSLSGHSFDLQLTRSRSRLTQDEFDELFPLNTPVLEPIVPKGFNFSFVPSANMKRALLAPKSIFRADLSKIDPTPLPTPHPANGSNNWAVSGKKSATGLPLLSNDIHLSLTLPALWYEMQLVSPNMNVYGISLPGAPGIILGFNRTLAWGVTNAEDDVLDWYQLRFRDEKRAEYLYDGGWRPVISYESEIKVRGQSSVKVAVRDTHFGPVVYDDNETPVIPTIPKGLAMHWAALEPSNELKNFMLLNRAKNVAECRQAIDSYQTPAQNFLCADNHGDIGIWEMGHLPLRWPGQGRVISDGSSSVYDWKGWVAKSEVPSVRNPERGFLSSANQFPTDNTYPYYLGWGFDVPYRAQRINEILKSHAKFAPEDFVTMQTDTKSNSAKMALPALLAALDRSSLNSMERDIVKDLEAWDYHYNETSLGAAVYASWIEELEDALWKPHFPDGKKLFRYPPLWKTIELLTVSENSPSLKWFDHLDTPERETRSIAVSKSFHAAVADVAKLSGSSNHQKWTWGRVRPTRFESFSRLPGLGSEEFSAGGSPHSIFANSGSHGPVWKQVVALGSPPRAWALYPGGQSGDPTSRHYDDFIEPWRKGEMKQAVFLLSNSNPIDDVKLESRWIFEPQSGTRK
jgi:penicillin amidase